MVYAAHSASMGHWKYKVVLSLNKWVLRICAGMWSPHVLHCKQVETVLKTYKWTHNPVEIRIERCLAYKRLVILGIHLMYYYYWNHYL